ncbi:hypothetical protein EG327_006018 [Venturia inaequalis]|uniref:Uncharacterized protein n=1 Tax=Venturia inaequalis TaxID=5025 RepID=A0A8H3VTE5_VENIN|nr:hypothetical protein EG327_006018 [Venturia inaequalis]
MDIKKMQHTPQAMSDFEVSEHNHDGDHHSCSFCNSKKLVSEIKTDAYSTRLWFQPSDKTRTSKSSMPAHTKRNIGEFPLTSELSPWVAKAMETFQPGSELLNSVKPCSKKLQDALEAERRISTGLHDLNLIELTYQYVFAFAVVAIAMPNRPAANKEVCRVTLEVAAAVILAADATDNPVDAGIALHVSKAGGDDHFEPWGKLLTGLKCDPPILAQFPFFLMMSQAFTSEPNSGQEQYVYATLMGVDWAGANIEFDRKFSLFKDLARSAVPKLDDEKSGHDRCFWRIAHAYLGAINTFETARPFRVPKTAAITHGMDPDLVVAMRGFDTTGTAYMCSDGAAFLDDAGIDSLVASALPNDIMDLHTDIQSGETRNLLRLLYPANRSIEETKITVSTLLSGMLSGIYRGLHRAHFGHREDGRIAACGPPYNFCRCRHRRIFETLELYMDAYPQFWAWTWDIYRMAKDQVTEAGLNEPLICALKRAGTTASLPTSPVTKLYDSYYELVEVQEPLPHENPLGVSDSTSRLIRDLYHLWHIELRDADKEPGWGRRFDVQSDKIFGDVGRVLSQNDDTNDMYKFANAYGRLSMTLPYIAYHTVAAVIMAYGYIPFHRSDAR